jgi:protocatechuate 3,4-dioxygenase, alpha subunit
MAKRPLTPSQTVGPYFSMKLEPVDLLFGRGFTCQPIRVEGRVLDGAGEPVEDALVEIWQANPIGRYLHPADRRDEIPLAPDFSGYGRVHTDFDTGLYAFTTAMPGQVPDPRGGLQAPHLCLIVTARGMLRHLHTRLYFGDEVAANAEDFVLGQVPAPRRPTLIAQRIGESVHPIPYAFDIRLQGDDETVFFDL